MSQPALDNFCKAVREFSEKIKDPRKKVVYAITYSLGEYDSEVGSVYVSNAPDANIVHESAALAVADFLFLFPTIRPWAESMKVSKEHSELFLHETLTTDMNESIDLFKKNNCVTLGRAILMSLDPKITIILQISASVLGASYMATQFRNHAPIDIDEDLSDEKLTAVIALAVRSSVLDDDSVTEEDLEEVLKKKCEEPTPTSSFLDKDDKKNDEPIFSYSEYKETK